VTAANQPPAAPAQAQGLRQKLKSARDPRSRARYPRAQALPLAALAPMLLQAAPALAPLLEKVLNPDTLKAVLDAPNRHLGTIINGIKDVANLAIQSHQQDLAHLRAIHPDLDDPALDALLASMSLGLSQAAREEPTYKRVAAVRLAIPDGPLVLMNGLELPAYRLGADWQIPLEVETPRPMPRARLHVVVKDAHSLEILLRKTADLGDVPAGPIIEPVHLSAQELSPLRPGHRYLLCMHLTWRNRDGAARGTSIQQEVLSIGALAFDRMEPEGEPIPLAAIERFRPFWHKVWSGRFERDVRRVILDIKYLITLDPEALENARMETRMKLEDGAGRREGRLKSGIVLSLPYLARLRQELDPEAEPLTPEMLDALAVPAFADGYALAARKMVKLHGGDGKSAALWACPEMKLARVVLLDPRGVDESGRVSELGEIAITVPKPALLHFVGVRT
jgi:hypothetical protein